VPKPAKGWTAFFVELTFASGGRYPLKFTTAVRVLPDTLPYDAPRRSTGGRP
jgi:PhoPQ-activated pathogenicity-related protein